MFVRLRRFSHGLRAFPRQFWVLTIGIFIYVGAAALALPVRGHLPAPEPAHVDDDDRRGLRSGPAGGHARAVLGRAPHRPARTPRGHPALGAGRRRVVRRLRLRHRALAGGGPRRARERVRLAALPDGEQRDDRRPPPAGAAAGGVRHHPRRHELRRRRRAGARRPGARVRRELPGALPLCRHGLPPHGRHDGGVDPREPAGERRAARAAPPTRRGAAATAGCSTTASSSCSAWRPSYRCSASATSARSTPCTSPASSACPAANGRIC